MCTCSGASDIPFRAADASICTKTPNGRFKIWVQTMHDLAIFVVGNLSLVFLGILCTLIAMLVPEEDANVEVAPDGAKITAEEGGDAGTNDESSE